MGHPTLVSICIPTYNRAHMITRAIDSALSQTYSDIEVIVVDDASTDSTGDIVASYHDPRVTYFKNAVNLGQFGNFNRCIELSHGKYIHILHSDDYIDSHFTETCVDFLEKNPGVAMTFTSAEVLSDTNKGNIGARTQDQIFTAPEGFREILRTRNLINCPSVMVRKDVYSSVGLYSLEYPYSGDLYQWLRIARRFDIAYVSGATLFYRQGNHSVSYEQLFRTPSGYIDTIKIFVRIVDELGSDVNGYSHELNRAYQRHLRDCLFAGFARSGSMSNYSSLIFIGLALSTWSMMRTPSVADWVTKTGNFFLIGAVACVLIVPGGQYITRKIFNLDTKGY
jgi:glycosyltransferase involved in cell wall biosynthesis